MVKLALGTWLPRTWSRPGLIEERKDPLRYNTLLCLGEEICERKQLFCLPV